MSLSTQEQLQKLRAERDTLLSDAAELRLRVKEMKTEGQRSSVTERMYNMAVKKEEEAMLKNDEIAAIRQLKLF